MAPTRAFIFDSPLKERQKLAEDRMDLKARIAKGERGLTTQDLKVVKTRHSSWRPITAELVFAMLNAGSFSTKLLSIRLRSAVSAELLWIARWLSVKMALAA